MPRDLSRIVLAIVPACLLFVAGGTAIGEEKKPATTKTPAAQTNAKGSAESPFETKINRGVQLRKRKLYPQAIAQFDSVLGMNPPAESAARCVFEKGQVLYLQGVDQFNSNAVDDAKAMETLRGSLAAFRKVTTAYPKQPTAANATYMAASTLIRLEQPEAALAVYQETYSKFPNYKSRSRALLRVGITLSGLDRMSEARQVFRRVWTEFPSRATNSRKARNYFQQLSIVGKRFTPLGADSWMFESIDQRGLSNFDGEVRAVVFVATWCTSCSKALPGLRKVVDLWTKQGVLFFGVVNPRDPKSTMAPSLYIEKSKLDFVDVALVSNTNVWHAYRGQSLPAIAIIDRAGIIRWRGHPSFFPSAITKKLLAE